MTDSLPGPSCGINRKLLLESPIFTAVTSVTSQNSKNPKFPKLSIRTNSKRKKEFVVPVPDYSVKQAKLVSEQQKRFWKLSPLNLWAPIETLIQSINRKEKKSVGDSKKTRVEAEKLPSKKP